MSLRVVAVGKKHEAWVQAAVERYQTRLRKPWDVEWVLLPHSAREGLLARQEESERILSRLGSHDMVVLLDETGANLSSPELSQELEAALANGKQLVFVIGGAYGVDERVQQRADLVWSLSRLVFPHQLVRLLLVEQIYRASEIARGSQYHHD